MKLHVFNRIGLTLHVLKTAASAGLSWFACLMIFHNHYPYFAALGAILTVQVTVVDSIHKAMQRVIGIVGGVIISIVVGHWLPLNPASITLVVLLGMAFATALRLNQQIISQVAVSSLLVLAFGKTPGYAIDRIVETMIGCAVAISLNSVLIPPNPIPDAEKRILHLSDYACTVLHHLAIGYREQALRPADMPYVQELVSETEKSVQIVNFAHQSLRYSPLLRNRRSRVMALAKVIGGLERITIQIRGIARGLVDLGPEVPPSPDLIEAMMTTATCVGLIAGREMSGSNDLAEALDLSIREARACQNVCLLRIKQIESLAVLREMGSILTDLNRILDEASGGGRAVTRREFSQI